MCRCVRYSVFPAQTGCSAMNPLPHRSSENRMRSHHQPPRARRKTQSFPLLTSHKGSLISNFRPERVGRLFHVYKCTNGYKFTKTLQSLPRRGKQAQSPPLSGLSAVSLTSRATVLPRCHGADIVWSRDPLGSTDNRTKVRVRLHSCVPTAR